MKRSVIFCLLLAAVGSAFAQQGAPMPVPIMPETQMTPQRMPLTNESALKESYKDSAEFAKYFKEIYAIIGPKHSVKKDANDYLARVSRTFTMQGIDSVKADSVALIGLDTNAYHKIYFETYRRHLTAIELKKYLDFIKTPEGKHVSEVLPQLNMAQAETSSYISRTISTNLAPLRRAMYEKMQKERPPMKGTPPPMPRPNQIPNGTQIPPMQPPSGPHTSPTFQDSTSHK